MVVFASHSIVELDEVAPLRHKSWRSKSGARRVADVAGKRSAPRASASRASASISAAPTPRRAKRGST